jgi:AbrB family looped-hinge helix DNA binding protein
MAEIENQDDCGCEETCCQVEALVSIDERGQMVLPKDIREKLGIRAGDKLAITSWSRDGRIACLSLTRANELTEMVKASIGPLMRSAV